MMPGSVMQSCIYEGWVRHRRFEPVRHEFGKRLFFLYLDLSELDQVFRGRLLWSTSRLAAARFRREDHLGEPRSSLADAVAEFLDSAGRRRPSGPVRLLTHLRYFGYVFNPLSLFYCYDQHNQLESVVAEVSNTPWNERHCYALDAHGLAPLGTKPGVDMRAPKRFHVSPFMPMDVEYRWRLTSPAERLTVSLENWRSDEKFFDVTMQLERREISTWTLMRMLSRYPFMTQQVIFSIYWQAWRLWLKGCPFFPHPQRRSSTTENLEASSSERPT